MGFNWTNIDSNIIITSDQYIEMKDACDTTATEIGISKYSWTSNSNIFRGNLITANSFNEMRDAVDYLDNNNYCGSHNNDRNTGHYNGEYATHNNSDYGTHKSGYWSGYYYIYDACEDSSERLGHEVGYDSSIESLYDSAEHHLKYETYWYTNCGYYEGENMGGHCATVYNEYCLNYGLL